MPLYIDPRTDIVYFGPHTCLRTVVKFIKDMHDKNIPITRIAVLAYTGDEPNESHKRSHNWKIDEAVTGPSREAYYLGVAIRDDCTFFEALHGLPEETIRKNMVPGLIALKDIFFILQTQLVEMSVGDILNTVDMRKTTHLVLYAKQVAQTVSIRGGVRKIAQGNGIDRFKGSQNKWNLDSKAAFHFVAFTRRHYDTRHYEVILVHEETVYKILWAVEKWS